MRKRKSSSKTSHAKLSVPMISGKGAKQKAAKAAAQPSTSTPATGDDAKVKLNSMIKPKQIKTSGMSALDAAAQVLADTGKAMTTQEMVDAMLAKGLWKTSGKTPAATVYAAIIREIAAKASGSRFRKTDRGHFTLAKGAK